MTEQKNSDISYDRKIRHHSRDWLKVKKNIRKWTPKNYDANERVANPVWE